MEFISEFRPFCSCNLHPLFLSQVIACFNSGSCISEGDIYIFWGTMTSVWKLLYNSPIKAEALKGIQAVLGFPELKIVKPSDTGCCMSAVLPIILNFLTKIFLLLISFLNICTNCLSNLKTFGCISL